MCPAVATCCFTPQKMSHSWKFFQINWAMSGGWQSRQFTLQDLKESLVQQYWGCVFMMKAKCREDLKPASHVLRRDNKDWLTARRLMFTETECMFQHFSINLSWNLYQGAAFSRLSGCTKSSLSHNTNFGHSQRSQCLSQPLTKLFLRRKAHWITTMCFSFESHSKTDILLFILFFCVRSQDLNASKTASQHSLFAITDSMILSTICIQAV